MDKILVLGAGLLGSQFKRQYGIEVINHETCDITSRFDVDAVLTKYSPNVVINTAGIVIRAIRETLDVFKVNALAPRMIAKLCDEKDMRLIQISSDCVFSGRKGSYSEIDFPDPADIYGMGKALGEITEFPHLAIRTSFVGFPDEKGRGLLASVVNEEIVTGWDKVFWNGLTVNELVKTIVEIVIPAKLSNVVHIHGETISKYELLKQAKSVFDFKYQLIKESEVTETPHESNRTLSTLLNELHIKKSFMQQLEEMKNG